MRPPVGGLSRRPCERRSRAWRAYSKTRAELPTRLVRISSRETYANAVTSHPSPCAAWGGVRGADGGVMSLCTDAHDPSVGVRRRHLPSEAGEEGECSDVTSLPTRSVGRCPRSGRRGHDPSVVV